MKTVSEYLSGRTDPVALTVVHEATGEDLWYRKTADAMRAEGWAPAVLGKGRARLWVPLGGQYAEQVALGDLKAKQEAQGAALRALHLAQRETLEAEGRYQVVLMEKWEGRQGQ